jgi:predicted component of type VI protein secretion system
MGVLRVMLLLILAAFLAGCAATTPPLQAQGNVSTKIAQPDRPPTAKVRSEARKLKLPAPKPTAASITADKGSMNLTTPNVGSPEWEKEQAENERKEQHIQRVMQSICRGC